MPFADKTRARLQAEAWRWANPTGHPQGLCYRFQLTTGRLAKPAVFDFLKSVTERKDKEVAANPRRFVMVQPPPFATQVLEVERPNAIDLALDRSCVHIRHG